MHAELAVLSLLSVPIIASIILYRPLCNNSTIFALALWLLICNIVYGVDAIIWAGNTSIHIPAWCDIVTRVLLAANVALPGASLGLSVDLERIASTRSIPDGIYAKRLRLIYDVTLCVLIPVFYISLHFIVQDHRFDIIKDFGCVASIYPSILSTVMMTLPSVIICMVALSFSGWAIRSTYQHTSSELAAHLATRSNFSVQGFRSRLLVATMTTIVSLVTTSISITSNGTLSPWISWANTHSEVGEIDVTVKFRGVQSAWFGVFIISFVFVLSSVVEEKRLEALDRWIPNFFSRFGTRNALLPTTHGNEMVSLSNRHVGPYNVNLVSGWDEMLNTKRERKPRPHALSIFPPSDDGHQQDDDIFAAETLRYLQSPVARSLGIVGPNNRFDTPSPIPLRPTPPPLESLFHAPPMDIVLDPAVSTSVADQEGTIFRRRPSVPEDAVSVISTLYDIPWPLPPAEAVPPRASSRFSTIDGADYPITRALLDQRKSPPVRLSSNHYNVSDVAFNTNIFYTSRNA